MSTQTVTLQINAQDNASGTLERVGNSTRDLIVGFSGVATSAFNLYNAYDRVADMTVSVDRANLNVKSTLNSVEDARRRLNVELNKEIVDDEKVKAATDDLRLAEERHQVAVERAEMMQGNLNETMVQSALMVIPTTITMVDSLGRIYKNLPDISGSLGKISSSIGTTGSTAATAALGVAAFMGGFLIADTLLKSVPENLRGVVGALVATIAAVVAATIAWMAFHGTMTVGIAVPIILAAIGVGIAGVKAAVGFAEGGYVTAPTPALIGEAGPEIVSPESKLREIFNERAQAQNITVYPNIYIGNISSDVDLAKVVDATSEGIAEAFRRIQ